ncbi:MAG TPA: hypothetical protein VK053_07770 [Jiangellaceae bacterium]|nr:hypothetical protein [Jiangellaceae bacterium]
MPTFHDPTNDAAEASAALRGLAHASRAFDDPVDTYAVLGDLLGGVRSLRQVLDQLAGTHLTNQARAHDDAGSHQAGAAQALAAADELHQAGTLLDGVEERLNRTLQASGRIAWHPDPAPEPETERRWLSVVFLQDEEADPVLRIIDSEGTDAAINHLSQWDYGEETTQSALANGYAYDTPPTGQWDRTASQGDYTLTYDFLHGHAGLLRAYTTTPAPEQPARQSDPVARNSQQRTAPARGTSSVRGEPIPAPFATPSRSAAPRDRGMSL